MAQLLENNPVALQIQEELANDKRLGGTSAGAQLGAEMNALIEKHERELENLKIEFKQASEKRDEAVKKELEDERIKLRREMNKWNAEKARLQEGLESARAEAASEKEVWRRKLEEQRGAFLRELAQQRRKMEEEHRQKEGARETEQEELRRKAEERLHKEEEQRRKAEEEVRDMKESFVRQIVAGVVMGVACVAAASRGHNK